MFFFKKKKKVKPQNLKDIHIEENELEGFMKMYYESGALMNEGSYRKGIPVGLFKEFYENGKSMSLGSYNAQGQLQGLYEEYYEDGKIKTKEMYENGKLLNKKQFDEYGNIFFEKNFEDEPQT